MTRTIKAKDILPGMTIRWGSGDVSCQCTLSRVERFNDAQDVQGETRHRQIVLIQGDKDVLVVKEPQPPEPTAFGACVEVAGVKYVRCDDDELEWKGIEVFGWWRWSELCDKGQVTVINPDPFANTEPREPRVWDRWEDVPQMTAVRVQGLESLFRKRGCDVERLSCGEWWSLPSMAGASAPFRGTFMEVALGA